ncbi:MAG TPA: DUF11 domain-containing protein, partial [Oceanithermus profundus]|nr:DUF11 domain-containing protein [Oceanithermus profundus]
MKGIKRRRRGAVNNLASLFFAALVWVAWSNAWAVSVELNQIVSEPAGGNCATGTFRISTNSSYQGVPLDVLLTVTAEDNEAEDEFNGDCVVVNDPNYQLTPSYSINLEDILGLFIKDNDNNNNVAWMELRLELVEQGTNTPVVVDRLQVAAFDLDAFPNYSDSDDVYFYNPSGSAVYLSENTDVAYSVVSLPSVGTAGLTYNSQLEGRNDGDCNDSASNPDPTCRGGAVFTQTSTVYFRVQNDNAYGEFSGDAVRLFMISFLVSDLEPIFTDNDYGDAPSSYGQAGLERTAYRSLGNALLPDGELAYQASAGANADDATTNSLIFDDEEAVTLGGNDLQGQTLAQGNTYTFDLATYNEAGVSGYLNAWIDWNHDGDFADAGERVVSNQLVTAGGASTTQVSVTVPTTTGGGTTYFRAIYSENTISSPDASGGGTGEVEDYAFLIPYMADLELSKTVSPANVQQGDQVTFTLTLTNTGPDGATGVEVTDQLPDGYT